MNTKKLIVFLLWAFLPMVIVGLVMHFSGASAVGLPEESSEPCSFRYSPLSLRN